MEKIFGAFNKLGRRERFGIIGALIVAVYFIVDISLLAPQSKRQKNAKAELARVDAEVAALRNEMVIVKSQLEKDPFAKDRAQLDQFKRVMDEADAFLAKVESDPRQVGNLLRQLISSTPGVTLVSLRTLAVTPVIDQRRAQQQPPAPTPSTPAAAAAAAKVPAPRSIYRRGIEVTVRGNYLSLLPYLEKLQAMPSRVLWGEAELTVQKYPDSLLRLTIYTLSSQSEATLG